MADLILGQLTVFFNQPIEHMRETYHGKLCGRTVVVMRSNRKNRIQREIDLAQRTDVFEGIAKLLYHVDEGNWHYFAYERFEHSVADFTNQWQYRDFLAPVSEQLAKIYNYVHSQDIILRVHDSRNFNVIFTNDEKSEVTVKFYGLGCSRVVEGSLLPEISSTMCGSGQERSNQNWTPPETNTANRTFGKKSDVYILANIFHQIGSGTTETPAREKNHAK